MLLVVAPLVVALLQEVEQKVVALPQVEALEAPLAVAFVLGVE